MKKLDEKISNPIIRGIVLIIFYIIIIILFLPSMPYAIVRGVCNLEYYEEWFDFINKFNPLNNDKEYNHKQ